MNRTLFRLAASSAMSVMLAAAMFSATVNIPSYTSQELSTPTFVSSEIQRLEQTRTELASELERSTGMSRLTASSSLQKVDLALEALRYVKDHGFNGSDPALKELPYFRGREIRSLPPRPAAPKPGPTPLDSKTKGMTPPIPITDLSVECTPELIGRGLSGLVKAQITVDDKGVPKDVQILSGLNPKVDAHVAATILSKWRYKPALLAGKPVTTYVRVAIPFDLSPSPVKRTVKGGQEAMGGSEKESDVPETGAAEPGSIKPTDAPPPPRKEKTSAPYTGRRPAPSPSSQNLR